MAAQMAKKTTASKTPSLKEYRHNPRKITSEQLEKLKRNIEELGDLSGIVHDLNTGEIISGNQRSKAIDIRKCEIVLTETYPEPTAEGTVAWGYVIWEGQRLSYREVRWNAAQRKKANVTANSLGGEWDWDILSAEFDAGLLEDWQVPIGDNFDSIGDDLDPNELSTEFSLKSGDKEPFEQMTFTLHTTQAEAVKRALSSVDITGLDTKNENKNGNALYKIIIEWDAQRK